MGGLGASKPGKTSFVFLIVSNTLPEEKKDEAPKPAGGFSFGGAASKPG